MMNFMVFQSLSKAPNYGISILRGIVFFFTMQLHLNAIHAVVQLRPSLEHLSSGGSKRKNNVVGDAEVSVKLEESAGEKSSGPSKKQVYVFYLMQPLCAYYGFL
jgi:DNA-directed RNA polymerase-3 subunit RPC5